MSDRGAVDGGVRVAVVTDSATALPDDIAHEHAITVVPLELADGRTAAPAPGAFERAVEQRLADDADAVVVVTLAAAFSASFQSATVAARRFGERVLVVDSGTAAGGEALIALAAARAAERMNAPAAVRDVALRAAREVRLIGTVPDLSHLARSGRIPRVAGWAGRTLRVSPLFELRAGQVRVLRPAHTSAAAVDRMLRRVAPNDGDARCALHVIALHACAPDAAHALLARVEAQHEPVTAFVAEFGPALVAHTGPGIVGLAWRWAPLDQ